MCHNIGHSNKHAKWPPSDLTPWTLTLHYVPSLAHDKKAEMKSNKGHCTCRKRACPVKQSSRPSTYYVSKDVGGLAQKKDFFLLIFSTGILSLLLDLR